MLSWMILLSVTARHRIEKLENENEKLRRENEKLRHEKELVEKEKEKLRQERDRLKDELDLARRAAKRQAAPFSKGEPKTDPRRPGRKPGVRYGRKGHRPIHPIVDEEIKVPHPRSGESGDGPYGRSGLRAFDRGVSDRSSARPWRKVQPDASPPVARDRVRPSAGRAPAEVSLFPSRRVPFHAEAFLSLDAASHFRFRAFRFDDEQLR